MERGAEDVGGTTHGLIVLNVLFNAAEMCQLAVIVTASRLCLILATFFPTIRPTIRNDHQLGISHLAHLVCQAHLPSKANCHVQLVGTTMAQTQS
jgi:hypothetical protein